ncbi:MAG: type VI secretion system tip protein TssI/VgrG [Polyangiaceae bacterium]
MEDDVDGRNVLVGGLGPFLTLTVDGVDCPLEVASFVAREALSDVGETRVRVFSDLAPAALARAVLGRDATLGLENDIEHPPRKLRGVVRAVEVRGTRHPHRADTGLFEFTLEPRLGLLRSRKTSRIHQDKDTREIVDALLTEWGIAREWRLAGPAPRWEYCVQHQESDYDFLKRVLGATGIFFLLDDSRDSEQVVVFGDSTAAYSGCGGPTGAPVIHYERSNAGGAEGRLVSFCERLALTPTAVFIRDYNPAQGSVIDAEATGPVPSPLSVYEYLPVHPLTPADASAQTLLAQATARARVFTGAGASSALRVGHGFQVTDHEEASLDGTYVVTSLTTRGQSSHLQPRQENGSSLAPTERLRQELEALAATDCFRPERPHRSPFHGLDSGVVVGPPGESVHTDSAGRVAVRFHWEDEAHPTWLRVAQPWNGPGHGALFTPRVGAEVLIGYVGGDLNRPVVLGCVPNGKTPQPFNLPAEQGLSGIVSQSLSGEGQSALVFDDTASRESVRLASQRVLTLSARTDLELATGRDERVAIGGSSSLTVRQDRREAVEGARTVRVAGNSVFEGEAATDVRLRGPLAVEVTDMSVLARGPSELEFQSTVACTTQDDLSLRVGGLTALRHDGTLAVTVGSPERPAGHLLHVTGRSAHEATKRLELSSEELVAVQSGESAITVSPKAIELRSAKLRVDADVIELVGKKVFIDGRELVRAEARRVLLLSQDASVCLSSEAKINGTLVKLASAPDPTDGPEARVSRPAPTKVELKDQRGRPLPSERFIVRLADGTTRPGVTDASGVAWLDGLTGPSTIDFLDLPNWKVD